MIPRWSEVTAVFGGTFDPPHLGHREAVMGLLKRPGVKDVLVLVSPSPHKTAVAPLEQRLAMAKLAFPRETNVQPDPQSYTFDTLSVLKRERGPLAFVIGTDQLAQLPTWKRFPEVLGLAHWIVLERKNSGSVREALSPLLAANLLKPAGPETWAIANGQTALAIVPTDAPEVSSTRIRMEIGRSGLVPINSVVPELSAYLKAHRIYGTEGEER